MGAVATGSPSSSSGISCESRPGPGFLRFFLGEEVERTGALMLVGGGDRGRIRASTSSSSDALERCLLRLVLVVGRWRLLRESGSLSLSSSSSEGGGRWSRRVVRVLAEELEGGWGDWSRVR